MIEPSASYGARSATWAGIQLPRNASMSLFLSDANVTGTDSTVMLGREPILRSSSAVSAVVEVTSVQPTSDKRTVRQLGGSASRAGTVPFAATPVSDAKPRAAWG